MIGGLLGLAVVGAGGYVLYTLYQRQQPPVEAVIPPTVDATTFIDSSETDEALINKEAQKLIYCRRKFKLKGDAISFEVDVSPDGKISVPARWIPASLNKSPFATCFEAVIETIPLTATGSAHVFRSTLKLTKGE